jgi:DNA-directed RNA polymerase specialized sigma subunit
MDKRPKRRKDKYNPYTLCSEKGRYYISFVDVNNNFQEIAVSQKVFESFNKFELEDISQMNEYDIHLEHSEVDENTLYQKSVSSEQPLEEYFDKAQDAENLHMAISKLPEVQKRRLNKYYFEEKTFDEIVLEEECTYQCVQRSVYRAVEKIKNILKNL